MVPQSWHQPRRLWEKAEGFEALETKIEREALEYQSVSSTTTQHDPVVSIIVPCRNEKAHIEASIRSILAQQPPCGGLEIIVADGLSDERDARHSRPASKRKPEHSGCSQRSLHSSSCSNAAIRVAARQDHHLNGCTHPSVRPDYAVRVCSGVPETGAGTAAVRAGGRGVRKNKPGYGRQRFKFPLANGGACGHDHLAMQERSSYRLSGVGLRASSRIGWSMREWSGTKAMDSPRLTRAGGRDLAIVANQAAGIGQEDRWPPVLPAGLADMPILAVRVDPELTRFRRRDATWSSDQVVLSLP